ncbi:uncharacterized protein DUF4954 [Anseongella ginsenosidimutans]|uniref:Uncharacterized protein DUF4954 n=1 Tax=Anseongella ginsenosidimutans TaxID=496056 RepID=A0A4R3KMI4_9SPHI|nr:DUF4954 family protein [Anseongella ginsenosidimutans]QEC54029.1 DUF4954 family protein [Anseongella ginsenosidimutans]TCS85206.1 uncharacterized protein DUF4954 [Anseongella ginsenosidimutans]
MNRIVKKPIDKLGYGFIEGVYLPESKDEYYLRDEQFRTDKKYRKLKAHEIEVLVKNENTSDDWNMILVTDKFNAGYVQGCNFFGKIRIGDLEPYLLEYHEIQHPVGLYNSTIISCDFGDNVVVDNVNHLSHYQVGNECMLMNINEMATSNHAKFGSGILKEGEEEKVRIWLELCNENGGRRILPFEGMLAGDAFLWTKYRDDQQLMESFKKLVDEKNDSRRGFYGTVGDRTVIKNCKIIKDAKIGSDAYIKGANKLKNLTVHSLPDAGTQIGEGCELVNGIINQGCRVFYGVKAVRFFMGSHSNLKYGARLINSYLGNNATVSCCEVLNSLIYPGHEQHHNNSFLCASRIEGQSNMAAGATIGSNHNSRGNDGEIVARRGFWPGLCVSLKHNSRFASYCLVNKGNYLYEMDIPLPFTFVYNDESTAKLYLMPAYWFMYNIYALARNAWKYRTRDKRIHKRQEIEYDYLAPDTANEMITAMRLLEKWVGQAYLEQQGKAGGTAGTQAGETDGTKPIDTTGTKPGETAATQGSEPDEDQLRQIGKDLLLNQEETVRGLTIKARNVENSRREVIVIKVGQAYRWYAEMLHHYGVSTLVHHFSGKAAADLLALREDFRFSSRGSWVNVGGQLIHEQDLEQLKDDIKQGRISSWDEIHARYLELGTAYPADKLNHAWLTLLEVNGAGEEELLSLWPSFLERSVETMERLAEGVHTSREKDYRNPFRKMLYESTSEMEAVIGKLEENDFVKLMQAEAADYRKQADELLQRNSYIGR